MPSAAFARLAIVRKKALDWPLNRFDLVKAVAAATAPALAVDEGRITAQLGRSSRRKVHGRGMTRFPSLSPSVRLGTMSLPSPLLNAVTPESASRKIA